MRVTVHLREGANATNARSEALGAALESAGASVEYLSRATAPKDSDLVVQTGFAPSNALRHAVDARIPYLIAEAPFWRDFYDVHTASSWGYNGLAGGAHAHRAPEEPRPAPKLLPMRKNASGTLIIGQKPTDHSLRGSDHVGWILGVKSEIPEADFRPHPLMVPHGTLEPLAEVLGDYGRIITYTSTVGAEALVAGCEVRADHRCSLAYGVTDREAWHHELSWRQAPHNRFSELGVHILSGYEEAKARAEAGLVETPREKVDGKAICERYYRSGL